MSRKRPTSKGDEPVPKLGRLVVKLADGRVMTREANAEHYCQNLPGHGRAIARKVTYSRADGRTWEDWHWDLSEVRPPPGAVLASFELLSRGWSRTFWYEDIERRCVQCGGDFEFSAKEQRYWYESLGFWRDSTAIRCPGCRRRARTEKGLLAQVALALRATEADPTSPMHWLELARVTAELRVLFGKGDIDRGISAARTAARLSQGAILEVLIWESILHRTAGRLGKAESLEGQFLSQASGDPRTKEVLRRAKRLGFSGALPDRVRQDGK